MAEGITRQSLAGLLDLDMRSITELARSGIVVGSGVRGRYLLAPSVRNYVRHLREIAAGWQGNELNAVDENARLKIAQRRNYDLKNSILEGSAIPYEAIAPAWARVVRAIRSAMLAIPVEARFRVQHLTPRDAEVIGEIIRDKLEGSMRRAGSCSRRTPARRDARSPVIRPAKAARQVRFGDVCRSWRRPTSTDCAPSPLKSSILQPRYRERRRVR
jgi:phage terminase Nu1 subunit (DNA packaging protein)